MMHKPHVYRVRLAATAQKLALTGAPCALQAAFQLTVARVDVMPAYPALLHLRLVQWHAKRANLAAIPATVLSIVRRARQGAMLVLVLSAAHPAQATRTLPFRVLPSASPVRLSRQPSCLVSLSWSRRWSAAKGTAVSWPLTLGWLG